MHQEAFAWLAAQVAEAGPFYRVLEIGSRNINGSVRPLFAQADYIGVDITGGLGVDVVCDATESLPAGPFDCVIAAEVFEHCAGWPKMVTLAAAEMAPSGVLLATMAGPGRAPHSGVDGGPVRDDEFYGNVDPAELEEMLQGLFDFVLVRHFADRGDLYALAGN